MNKTLATLITTGLVLGGTHAAGADTGRTCAQFDTRFIRTVTTETETKPLPVTLPAGVYTLEITTSDSYEDRVNAVLADQDSERVEVLGVVTDDLPDGVVTAEATKTAEVTLTGDTTEITATHVHGGHGWQSVLVGTVCLTPVVVEHPPVTIPEHAPPAPEVTVPAPPAPVVPPVSELPVIKTPKFNG